MTALLAAAERMPSNTANSDHAAMAQAATVQRKWW